MADARDPRDGSTTADERGELFGVHIPELQLPGREYRAALEAARLGDDEVYLELGSGHGRGIVIAARDFGAESIGVEYLEDAIARTQRSAERAGVADRVRLMREDLRRIDPSGADVIHMHLGPAFHDVLAARLERLLAPHARVVAAGWRVPGWQPLPDALDRWDGGYVYRPADPRMQASWGARGQLADGTPTIEFRVNADLAELQPRLDGIPAAGRVEPDRTDAARGTAVLLALPPAGSGELTVWARCRAGRITQRGPSVATVSRRNGAP